MKTLWTLLFAFLSTGAGAQTTARPPSLVVKDSANKLLGVAEFNSVWDGYAVKMFYIDGPELLGLYLRPNGVELSGYSEDTFYETLDCTGTPYIVALSQWVTAVGGSTKEGRIYRQDGPARLDVDVRSAYVNDGLGCRTGDLENTPLAPGRPLDLSAFTPPFHIATR